MAPCRRRASPPRETGVIAMMSLRIVGVVWSLGAPRQTCISGLLILAEIQEGGDTSEAALACIELG